MKKEAWTSILFILLLVGVLVFAGCSGMFSGSKRGRCSDGDNCVYYSGNRGVMMYLDTPPRILYYRTSDFMNQLDGNSMELNVRLLNDGASDSYGAVFLTGFSGDMFRIYRLDNGGRNEVLINKDRNGCYFDLMSLGKVVGDWNFATGCLGMSLNTFGGLNNLNIGDEFFQILHDQWGWNIPLDGLQLTWNDNGTILNFGIGTNWGILNYGRSLMVVVSSLNFEGLGGSVFRMKGDNAEFPGGDIDYKTFEVQMIAPWPSGQDFYNLPYQIKSCYAYTTFVSPMICVDPDPFSDEQKVCRSETYVWGGSQGAPVAVTRLDQTNTGKEVILDITIRNIGPGTVWDVGYLEGCSPYFPGKVRPSMKDVVYIGYAYIGTRALDCSNYYSVRLDPNTKEARITCRYNMNDADDIGSAYAIPLRMELWYGYEETISQQVTVRKLN